MGVSSSASTSTQMSFLNAVDLDGLRCFVAVAKYGSFQQATVELNISAPALTRRIQRLEQALGTTLFERTTRRVQLTPVGTSFLPRVQQILAQLQESLTEIDDELYGRQGQVTLGCLPTAMRLLMPQILRVFHERAPHARIRIVECSASDVSAGLKRGTLDFGLTLQPQPQIEMPFDELVNEPFVLVAPAGHPLAGKEQVCWNDLKPYRLIISEPGSGNRNVLELAMRRWRWQRELLVEIDHLTSALGLVEAGLGISVMPVSALPDVPGSKLVLRSLKKPEVFRTLGLLRNRSRSLTTTAQQFRRLVRQLAPAFQSQIDNKYAHFFCPVSGAGVGASQCVHSGAERGEPLPGEMQLRFADSRGRDPRNREHSHD